MPQMSNILWYFAVCHGHILLNMTTLKVRRENRMSKASSIAKEVQFLSQRYSANWEEFSMVKLDNK